jgi:hypothetical protein
MEKAGPVAHRNELEFVVLTSLYLIIFGTCS